MELKVDLSGFVDLTSALKSGVRGGLEGVARDLAEDAESYAFDRIDLMIYSQPERFYNGEPYIRTGLLKKSLQASGEATADGLSVSLTTGPAAGGRRYGARNELGVGKSRISLERVLRDARASADPLNLPAYDRQDELEARPTVLPVMARLEDEIQDRLFKLVEDAGR